MLMLSRSLTLLAIFAFESVVAATAQSPAPQMPPGTVLVEKVKGTATLVVGGVNTNLKIDDRVPQAAIIRTTSESSITLVFSNGTTLHLGSDAELVIREFLQAPFTGAVAVATLTQEPSISRTALELKRGELLGDVKRLLDDLGSAFTITTSSGVVDSAGGSLRLAVRIDGAGSGAFSLKAEDREIGFTAPADKTNVAPPGGKRFVVQPGKEISVNVGIAPKR